MKTKEKQINKVEICRNSSQHPWIKRYTNWTRTGLFSTKDGLSTTIESRRRIDFKTTTLNKHKTMTFQRDVAIFLANDDAYLWTRCLLWFYLNQRSKAMQFRRKRLNGTSQTMQWAHRVRVNMYVLWCCYDAKPIMQQVQSISHYIYEAYCIV